MNAIYLKAKSFSPNELKIYSIFLIPSLICICKGLKSNRFFNIRKRVLKI